MPNLTVQDRTIIAALRKNTSSGGGSVVSVTGDGTTASVDNTDPSNPVVSASLALASANSYTDAQIATLPPPGISDAPSDGKTYGRKDGAWAEAGGGGSTGALIVPIYAGQLSTKATAGNKRLAGSLSFDAGDPAWGLKPTSTARLCVLLETTNGLSAANAELLFRPAVGAPVVIATAPSVTALIATLSTVDVSAHFRPASPAGVFQLRMWSSLATESSTCTGSWIEVTP